MEFVSYFSSRNSIKAALQLQNNTLTFDGSFSVKAKASELTRAPFIQTLYAGMDSIRCLLISRTDLDVLYPTKENKLDNKNQEILQVY